MTGQTGKSRKGIWLMAAGALLMAAALALAGYNLWDEHRAAGSAEAVLNQMPEKMMDALPAPETGFEESLPAMKETGEAVEEIPDYILNPGMEMPVTEIDGHDYIGVLEIPVLGLRLPVMSSWSYPNLKVSPCRYSGSAYQDNLIIAGHNYQRHFGGIGSLTEGDYIFFVDADANIFSYRVAALEWLNPGDVEQMEEVGDFSLTLFSCTPDTRYRVTVRCESASDFSLAQR